MTFSSSVQQQRQAWRERTEGVDPRRFVFLDLVILDQSNAKTTMTRRYGRAPRGERVVCHVPDGRYESITTSRSRRVDHDALGLAL
jgi:hypothetical protein